MPNKKESIEANELKGKKNTDKKESFNNKVVRIFDGVLDVDESILKSYKPSKLSVYMQNLAKPFIVYFIFVMLFLILYLFPSEELTKNDALIFFYCISGFIVVIEVIMFLITKKYLKRVCYIITNKRVIISCGFFDLEFKSIDLKSVKDVELRWSFVDKILRKKSGQIYFYPDKKELPVVLFFNVENPVDTYVEIENFMEKNNGSNS